MMDVEEEKIEKKPEIPIFYCGEHLRWSKIEIRATKECTICQKILCEECDLLFHSYNNALHYRTSPGESVNKVCYDENDFFLFRNKYQPSYLLTMRMQKCKTLYKKLSEKGKMLIKSPPGSGKTFMGMLFMFYCEQFIKKEKIKVSYINCETHNQNDFLENLQKKSGYKLMDLKNISEGNHIIIVDETQRLYGFTELFNTIKTCSETKSCYVKFLCLSAYADIRANTSEESTPLCFDSENTISLPFLRYDEEEYEELLVSYQKNYPESNLFPIDEEIKQKIKGVTLNHPELTFKTIEFLHKNLKNETSKNVNEVTNCLYSTKYFLFIKCSKACPDLKNFSKYNETHKTLIQKIFRENGIISNEFESDQYKLLKELERYGFVYQRIEDFYFNFVSPILGSIIFDISIDIVYVPLRGVEKLSIIELAMKAFERISQQSLQNASEFRQRNLAEDQWICEFYSALKSIIGDSRAKVIVQAGSEVNKPEANLWNGELDIYVNGPFKYGYELLINGNDVLGHILRKFRAESDYFENIEFKSGGKYKFPENTQYLVIDIREDDRVFYDIKERIKDKSGKEIDLAKFELKKYLMRVIYNKEFTKFTIYIEEKKYKTYELK